MANNHSIQADQLREGQVITIRGKLAFARLTRRIEGQELVEANNRRRANRMYPATSPYTTVTIIEPEVIFADANAPTPEEQYVAERRYYSKKNPETGLNWTVDSKGNNLPIIAVPAEDGSSTFVQDTSGRELAQGVDVTLVLEVYKAKDQENRGLGLTHVVVNETPRYYSSGGVDQSVLAARGITFSGTPQAAPAAGAQTTGDSAPLESEYETDQESDLPFPTPQAAGQIQQAVPAQQAQPTPVQPVQQAAAPAPQPPAQAEETPEQKLARLEVENARLKDAGSAVGAPTQAGPWDQPQQPGITYQQG